MTKISAVPAVAVAALTRANVPPTRHAFGRVCYRLTGRSLSQCPPRLFAAAVKRARKSGTLAAVAGGAR